MTGVSKIVKEWYLRKKEDHEPLSKGSFYASSVAKCPRQVLLEKLNPKMEISDRLLGIFLIGDALHEVVQEAVGGEIEKEVVIKRGGITIRGRADIVTKDEVIELKTISDVSKVRLRPKHNHYMQLQVYLGGLKRKKGRLVYISKQNFEIVEHEIKFSKEAFEEAINYFKVIKDFEDKGKLPPRFETNWCWYCPFRKDCFK